MQQLATTAPQSQDRSFADLLAGLAHPAKKPPQRDLNGLEEDVATLSYEQALRNRALSPHPSAEFSAPNPAARATTQGKLPAGSPHSARRSSSVTVRFSPSEAEQLHARAAEAGLTVSAYLRSCAFEVEGLRTEVKSALAQLRSTTPASGATASQPQRIWFRRWRRLFRSGKLDP